MIQSVGVLGAGAVGCYFLWGLQEKLGDQLCIIADGERKTRYESEGRLINGTRYQIPVKTPEEARGIDLLLIATKYHSLKDSLADIEMIVDSHTIVLCLLNGVDSEEIVASRIGQGNIIPSMMQIASQRVENQITFVPERTPGVFFGESDGNNDTSRISDLMELFLGTELHYHICDNIWKEIWLKMAFNVSMNLPQAIVGCPVGAYVTSQHMADLRWKLREEVRLIAEARGIDIHELSQIEAAKHPSAPQSKYSTLQDLEAGRHTEIDMFAGTLMRMGREYGIPTPYCEFAYHLIKALEEKNDKQFIYE